MSKRLAASEPDCSTGSAPFWARMQETIAWCLTRVDAAAPAACLRSDDVRPPTLYTSLDVALVAVAGGQRRYGRELPRVGDLCGGRLLVYFPDADLCDGAAQAESAGFLDVYNCPPWGTWVGVFSDLGARRDYENYLVAWIPREFVDLTDGGIDVNPEKCIVWLDDSTVAMRALLAKAA